MQIHWAKINKIIQEAPEIRTYFLECPKDFDWEEGSFTHLGLEGFNDEDNPSRNLVRHMSISTLPQENTIGITTRIKEQCSEYKSILRNLEVGDQVAIFRTFCNVPLKRENKNIYLLSSGVGLATFRPLILDYLERAEGINHMYSLNIESSKNFLFSDVFESASEKHFTSQFVDNRKEYYEKVKNHALDKDGLFYIVGSDRFLEENIAVLLKQGIEPTQIMLDKREQEVSNFLSK